jgi:energy-coupling factor transport system permease protein
VLVGVGLWAVQRWEPAIAHPGVQDAPQLSLLAVASVLCGVVPVWAAPPPLTVRSRERVAVPPGTEREPEPEAVAV